jgi:hypothetical protein
MSRSDRLTKGGDVFEGARNFDRSLIGHNRISNSATFEIEVVPVPQGFLQRTVDSRILTIWRLPMDTLANACLPAVEVPAHPLKAIAVFLGLAVGSYACIATYGLDLSVGFF